MSFRQGQDITYQERYERIILLGIEMILSLETHSIDRVSTSRVTLERRTRELLQTEIDFISNPKFHGREAEHEILHGSFSNDSDETPDLMPTKHSQNLPSHLARLCEADVLSAEEEQALFREMNFLKYKANSLRSQLDPDLPDEDQINRIEAYLNAAQRVRSHLLRCNMRLVVSIIKKCVTPHISFDELLSDGIWSLIKAVDKFDYGRGFRFSTYAYHAISNFAHRKIANQRKANSRFTLATHSSALDEAPEDNEPAMNEQIWQELSTLIGKAMDNLDQREQLIIRGRFALGEQKKVRTFQSLADELGISKERVRQLEQRAVAKLRLKAEETDIEIMCELAGY